MLLYVGDALDGAADGVQQAVGMGLGQVGAVLTIYVATALFGLTAYLYVVNRPIGLILLVFLIILFELFIEYTGMISPKYRPILSLVDRMTNKKESEE